MSKMTRNFFTVLTVLLAVRAVASVAVVTPVSVNAGGNVTTKDLVIYSPPRNVTQLGLSTTSSDAVDIGPVGGVIWGAIITGSFSYSGSVCGAAITVGGPAGIAACAVAIAGTVITSAFAAYYYGNAKRSEDIDWDVNPTYAPTLGCSTGCQLEAQTSHGTWTHFANKTTNGRFHSLYFYQNNTIKGLKAVQHNTQPPALNTREDPLITEAVDEGSSTYGDQNWIGTYYWEDGSESAWDGWSAEDNQVSIDLGEFMVDNKAQGACFDAADNQGGAIASIFLLDYSDEILEYTSNSQIEEALDECIGIMPAADQKRRLRRKQTP